MPRPVGATTATPTTFNATSTSTGCAWPRPSRCCSVPGPSRPAHRRDGLALAQHDRRLLEGEPLEPAWDLVEKLAADGSDAVLCGHGDLLPELVRRAQLRGMRVPGACGCAKGSVWTLTWDGTGFVSGVYTPVPG